MDRSLDPQHGRALLPAWTPRPIVVAAVAAVLGAVAAQMLGPLGVALACTPLLVCAFARRRLNAWCLAVPAGLGAYGPEPPVDLPALSAGPVAVRGQVVSRLVVDDLRGSTRCIVAHGRTRVLCIFPRDTSLRPGDSVRALGRLAPRAQGRDRVLGVVEVPEGGLVAVARARSLTAAAESLRLALHDALVDAVPGRAGRLLAQLVLGHGGEVDGDIADAHRATGLSHLLAVSGAHVSLLAGMLGVLAMGWRRSARPPWAVLAAVAFYGTITGLDPPVLRALVAFALLLIARRHGLRLPPVAALAAPGLLTALLQPQDTTSASFALSYAAVAGLALTPLPPHPRTPARALGYALAASGWATLATAPFTLHLFGQIAPWTILASPVLAPLVAAMLALGLVLATAGALDADAAWLALPLRVLVETYMTCVEGLAELPGAPVFALSRPPFLLLCCCAILGVLALLARPGRVGAAGLCLAIALAHFVPWPAPRVPGLVLLDVGHGQACVVHLPTGQTAVVDCGSQGNPRRAAEAVGRCLAPHRRIDLLVLTHGDADHAGGVLSLLRRCGVDTAVLPSELSQGPVAHALRRAGAHVLALAHGERREPLPGFVVSRPADFGARQSNDRGLWARADLGSTAVLFPGDAEEAGVRAWLASPHRTSAGVLVLPHHGRDHAAIEPLLAAVAPRLALVSGGSTDRASPSGRVAARRGIRVVETAHVGDVVLHASSPPHLVLARPEPLLDASSR